MLRLSRILVAVKQAVIRGVVRHGDVKLPSVEAHVVELKKDLTTAPWLALDPMIWPFQRTDEKPVVSRAPSGSALISNSSDFLPCSSSPSSSATPSMFSEDNSSTVRVLTMPHPCIPNIILQSEHLHTGVIPTISDYDAEKSGRMFLKKTAKVPQLSESDANTPVREDPKSLGFWLPMALPCFEEEEESYSYEDLYFTNGHDTLFGS
ncbi:hypothetical protein JB92DRAFT_2828007 [Gautieria morchelliformis]|nr:hypothetical protein JB92DRAFT_2828007 [Gautieria morchelliformis]